MFSFHAYGFVIAIAIIAAYLTAYLRRKKYGFTTIDLENLFLYTMPLGIIGARIYHVVDKWQYYSQFPLDILAVWNGGLGIYGAIMGGLVGIWIFIKVYGLRFTVYGNQIKKTVHRTPYSVYQILNFLIPSLAIGQAIGRWGNYFNHEVFGPPTNLPWGWYIPEQLRPEFWQNYQYFHPTFAYESLWVLVGFFVLLIIEKNLPDNLLRSPANYQITGLITAFYAIWYGVGRFFLEFLRFDTARIGSINVAQLVSVLLVVWGVVRMYRIGKWYFVFSS